jgi:hypothetical protein
VTRVAPIAPALAIGLLAGLSVACEARVERRPTPAPPAASAGAACRDWAVERVLYEGTGCPHPDQELSVEGVEGTSWLKCRCRRTEADWEATARAAIERLLVARGCDGDMAAGGAR